MTENLLEAAPADTEGANPESAPAELPASEGSGDDLSESPAAAGPPPGLPEKFWDAEHGALRADTLVKSYLTLERKLGALGGRGVPEDPGGYEIEVENELFASDPDVNVRLHAAGFTQDQAQTVYDMASEYMLPMVAEVADAFHAQTQIDRLAERFGGEDKWRETAAQLKSWGRSRFPDDVYTALASTYDGILTMHRMMRDGDTEPGLIEGAGAGGGGLSEDGLRRMMQDPRYWRDHDPSFVEHVQDGFKRLFPD